MTHVPHELIEEFPHRADRIHELKTTDAHFARLAEEYHAINRDVHRAETNIAPTDDLNMAKMRKTRMMLKDEIAQMLG